MGVQEQQNMRKVQQKFKMRGLTLTLDALKAVMSHLEEAPNVDQALSDIFSEMDKTSLKSNFVSKDAILEVLSAAAGGDVHEQNRLIVVDVFNLPKLCYDHVRKSFYRCPDLPTNHGEASAKAALYRDRFQLLQQRVLRDRHFTKPSFGRNNSATGSCELTPLQGLIGCPGKHWVMGTIYQVEDDRFCLEDLTGSVPVDFSEAKITTGFFTENCVIVAEGEYMTNGVFKIRTMGFPPLEHRSVSLSVTAGLDCFGAGVLNSEETMKLEQIEESTNDMFIILAEVWLDHEETMQKLTQVFDGYETLEVVPSLFILMGNFCSHPCNRAFNEFAKLRSHFGKLGEVISAHPRIKEASRFIFIPGPDDIGPANVLPRPPLPKFFTNEVLKHVPNSIFASNPCRIRFYSQEIVLFRDDILYRTRRNCIIPPSNEETQDNFQHLVATVLHQSHLCPLPLTSQPISWPLDHVLRLYPLPHTVVLADRLIQKVFNYTGVTSFSPGSFSHDGAFIAYRPGSKEAEISSI
ncbi:DNA polymerase epsilon subunit 2 [Marchantia polymorpha subsp. ruderalis]|uniref:DNA polymerase epsilon subunit n=2 Tax=Marchantia polymorpha TaxID=3197 RepID=A0AAF6BYA7_MARPO|nr:hypothetical protein MARPO_0003s0120 [Marchantia polymorpha]BBN16991.1 hypothetical protein Mp_7g11060 [Marchantia polymorpha subsp. ruderalis]|eukprot:PTQ49228.1 hypothetical protein MARPO_0003s0120 [Marchantia polymorpha]